MKRQPVVLWDIDGSLLSLSRGETKSAHIQVLNQFGVSCMNETGSPPGSTDYEVLLNFFESSNSEKNKLTEEVFHKLGEVSSQIYANYLFELLPDVRETLSRLQLGGVRNGILTGNSYPRMIHKLESSRLINLFDKNILFYCKFGDTREDIGKRARDFLTHQEMFSNTFIVGDTIRDIGLAKEFGFRAIAVATGVTSFEVLNSHSPDLAIKNLEDGSKEFFDLVFSLC